MSDRDETMSDRDETMSDRERFKQLIDETIARLTPPPPVPACDSNTSITLVEVAQNARDAAQRVALEARQQAEIERIIETRMQ
jgi:hypothetical protein